MQLNQETLRFIFGIKLRNLRLERKQSLKELAKASGMSPSYINEIEKGKKYPKSDKILLLAESLGVTYDELASVQLNREMNSISKILQADLLRGVPFDIFGLPAQNIFELVAESPNEFSALIGAFLELSRLYDIRVEDFFYASLRAYLDRHQNWLPQLERKAFSFSMESSIHFSEKTDLLIGQLKDLLKKEYSIDVAEKDFSASNQLLSHLHFVHDLKGRFILNSVLPSREKVFLLAKEIGFNHLKLKDRTATSDISSIDGFDQVFNNFQASYFASSLLIPAETLRTKLVQLFSKKSWSGLQFEKILNEFPCTPDNVFHRMSQVFPEQFGLTKLFLLKMQWKSSEGYQLTRELHLSNLHSPHSVKSNQHYCRRWITTALIERLRNSEKSDSLVTGCQISSFWNSSQKYVCFSVAYPSPTDPEVFEGTTLGLEMTEDVERLIRFHADPVLERKVVSSTCETCQVDDCEVRKAPKIEQEHDTELQQAIEKLF